MQTVHAWRNSGIARVTTLAFAFAQAVACTTGTTLPDGGTPEDGGIVDTFDDHTVPYLVDESEFFARAPEGGVTRAMKFVITEFGDASRRRTRHYDSYFFALHDEWYWFRLMNDTAVPGDGTVPYPGVFPTVQSITDWAATQSTLPLDLRYVGERLYSPRFYELGLARDPKVLGLGTVIYIAPRDEEPIRPAQWAFELEYQDSVTHDELVIFFEELIATLPASMTDNLKWLVRSPTQETLAVTMEEGELTYHDRIMRYAELAVPGEVEVYSEGISAGRLLMKRTGEPIEGSSAFDILVTDEIPDFLPPCAGLITALPQTPLAHINILARNRGIPNAYMGGVTSDVGLEQLARVRAPVAIRAVAPDQLDIIALTETEYTAWRNLVTTTPLFVPPVDFSNAPYAIDLTAHALDEADALRPLIGGKAAGFLALLEPKTVTTPDWPMALTGRAYREHIAPLESDLTEMIDDADFRADAALRVLVLEGEAAYDERFPSALDQTKKQTFMQSHEDEGTAIGRILARGSVTGIIIDTPVAAATMNTLDDAIRTQYAPMSPAQGLRFRSSSTVEDVEGFNGAGLYTSNTGFVEPPNGDVRTLELAVKRTWASYWGMEAFEERRLAGITHTAGNMGIVVHPRFDDDKELSNGVYTYTLLPDDVPGRAMMEMNAQMGALSVTNPPPGVFALPEVSRVYVDDDGQFTIERIASSTETAPGEHVLSDGELLFIATDAHAVAVEWLDEVNKDLLSAQKARAVVLDYEYREMDEGWPTLANGNAFGVRLVTKQVRSLEPSILRIPLQLRSQPFPRDVLLRTRKIERKVCTGPDVEVAALESYTDPLLTPDLGYSSAPFAAFVSVEATTAFLGFMPGNKSSIVHVHASSMTHPGMAATGQYKLDVAVLPQYQASMRLSHLVVDEAALTITIDDGDENVTLPLIGCTTERIFASPEEFLAGFFDD
jgi:hypothetical protein